MKLRFSSFAYMVAAAGFAACLPGAGDPTVDRNKDGIADNSVGGVRSIDTIMQFAPTSPTVNVFGALHNGYTGEPIANVTVTILTSKDVKFTVATNESGGFQVAGVSPGSFVLEASPDGMMPVRAVLAAAAPGGNTDNTNQYLGKIYALPTDGTWSFSVYSEDGRPVANAPVYVDVPSMLIDGRTHNGAGGVDLGNGAQATGFRTVVATTNAAGVAQVPNVPDVKKLFYFFDGLGVGMGTTRFTAAWVGSVDFDNDGTMDAGGSFNQWAVAAFFNANGKVALTPLSTFLDGTKALIPVVVNGVMSGNVTIDGGPANATQNAITRYVGTSEALVIIFNQPIDPAMVAISVLNDWANNRNNTTGTLGGGGVLDNSTPAINGQGFPIAKAQYETKPAAGGAATLVAAVDPSGTILTLTPTIPWQAGAEYIISGQVSSLRHSQSGGTGTGSTSPRTYVFSSRSTGFHTAPAAAALSIAKVFIERNDGGDNYGNIVIQLSEVVQSYTDDPLNTGNRYILVCADQDFGVNGRVTTGANGFQALDTGECPPAGYQLRATDIGGVTGGMRRATLRTNSAQVKNKAGRFFEIAPSAINAALSGKSAVNLRVYVNPLVDGQMFAGILSGVNPTAPGQNLLSNMVGNSYPTAVLSADVTIAPVSMTPTVQLELPTNNPPQFQ